MGIAFRSFSHEMQKLSGARADLAIYRKLLAASPVKVKLTRDADLYGGGYFDQVRKEIGLSKKEFQALAHEIGHAKIDEHLLGKLIQSRVARLAFAASPLAGFGAGALLAKGKKWGLLLPLATIAPTLISEALATHKGKKLLEESKASNEQTSSYDSKLRKAYLTYLVNPALSILSVAHGAAMSKKFK